MDPVRLNKYLSECGIASRRKADELIAQGRVSVNGQSIKSLGYKVDPQTDQVKVDGQNIKQENKVYFLLNKPKGVITSTSDEKGRITVVELINSREKIFPVGRLDYNTTGVLLLTNDGEFANHIIHPKNKIERLYSATLSRELSEEDKFKLLRGIILDNKKSRFNKISFPVKNNYKKVQVVTVEGRNHFVKNMFSTLGYLVKKLNRDSIGVFSTIGLEQGNYRKISKKEINSFIKNN